MESSWLQAAYLKPQHRGTDLRFSVMSYGQYASTVARETKVACIMDRAHFLSRKNRHVDLDALNLQRQTKVLIPWRRKT